MRRFLAASALAIATSAFSMAASAHDGPPPTFRPGPPPVASASLHLENTWTGVNGATRNRNSSFRYVIDRLPTLPKPPRECHGGPRHDGPPPHHGHGHHRPHHHDAPPRF